MRHILLAMLTLLFACALAQDQEEQAPQSTITVTQISDAFYMISTEQPGDSTVLLNLGEDGPLLVDSHWSFNHEGIQQAISQITDEPVRYVINTHWHPDHVHANALFHDDGAQLFSHDNARRRMAEGQTIEFFQEEVPPYPEAALPQVTFDSEMTLHLNGNDILAFFTAPAHTDGDIVIYFSEGNVVQMGDTFLNGTYPFLDLSSGGDAEGSLAVLERVIEVIDEDTVVVPGHGPLADYQELRDYRDMVATVLERVEEAIDEGLTLEQALEADLTEEFDDRYDNAPFTSEVFVTELYTSLTGR